MVVLKQIALLWVIIAVAWVWFGSGEDWGNKIVISLPLAILLFVFTKVGQALGIGKTLKDADKK